MEMLAIHSEQEYQAALKEIESLMTAEGNRLNVLADLVQDWERQRVRLI